MINWNNELLYDLVSTLRQCIEAVNDRLVLNKEELNEDEKLEALQVQINAVTNLENSLLIYNNLLPEKEETKRYAKKLEFVDAYRTNRTVEINSADGIVTAYPGDYIVTDSYGQQTVWKPSLFFSKFDELVKNKEKPYQMVGGNRGQ